MIDQENDADENSEVPEERSKHDKDKSVGAECNRHRVIGQREGCKRGASYHNNENITCEACRDRSFAEDNPPDDA